MFNNKRRTGQSGPVCVSIHGVDILGADILGADTLGADILGADILGADTLGADTRCHSLTVIKSKITDSQVENDLTF